MCCCGSSLAIAQALAQARADAQEAVADLDQGQSARAPLECTTVVTLSSSPLAGWLRQLAAKAKLR
jgi:hypothetical protein